MPFAFPHPLCGLHRWWLQRQREVRGSVRRCEPAASDAALSAAHTLGAGAVRRLHLRSGDALQVRVGGLWLTRAGDPQDHLLQPGAGFVAVHSGDVVVQAFGACACHFERHGLERRRFIGGWGVGERRPDGRPSVQASDAGVS